jgi:CheY-like chemotaxis protein
MRNLSLGGPDQFAGIGAPSRDVDAADERRRDDGGSRNATILVVEDDADIRELVEEILSEHGYHVLSAPDGMTALAILRRERQIDLLFTDIVMPGGLNGAQLADAAVRINPDIKVLLASGYANPSALGAIRLRHSRMFIPKPYRPRQLAARIDSLLDT